MPIFSAPVRHRVAKSLFPASRRLAGVDMAESPVVLDMLESSCGKCKPISSRVLQLYMKSVDHRLMMVGFLETVLPTLSDSLEILIAR